MKRRLMSLLLSLALCLSMFPAAFAAERDTSAEELLAAGLKQLGIFQGVSENDFALRRAPNRDEALVMLIRILGKESEALSGTWRHPFTDVADWANKYVGYAYQSGLTNGVSPTLFGSGQASATMYLTFVLRALGYSDTGGTDFTWDNPFDLAKQVGILPDGTDTVDFWRADVARISHAALSAKLKGSNQTLAEKLIAAGVFTKSQYEAVYGKAAIQPSGSTSGGQAIYQQCSPAVFRIDTLDMDGDSYFFGSGFFIDGSGVAVTNHHVLKNARSATATTVDGKEHAVAGIIYADPELDFAVIRVEGSGFPALPIGDSTAVTGGETVYAIGNPEGLNNTISDGIVSNPKRADYYDMIQISAPISSGSSGGALLNTAGEVIGITTSGYVDGQNLNFAVPIHQLELGKRLPPLKNQTQTLLEYAALCDKAAYENLPDPYDQAYLEDDILELDIGDTVLGTLEGDELDTYYVHCSTPGAIEVLLLSGPEDYLKRCLMLCAEPADESEDPVYSEFETDADGSYRYLRMVVDQPGVFAINVFPYLEDGAAAQSVEYDLYYVFTPGDTAGENTDGVGQLAAALDTNPAQRRQEAYAALKTWITSAGSFCYDEVSVSDSGAEIKYRVAVSDPGLELLYSYKLNNVSTYVKLDLPPTSDWAQSTVSVYKHDDWDNNVSAAVNVSIPEFCADYNYWFYYKSGPANEISYYERLGKDVCLDLLDFANHVLSDCMHTDYTVADLGYTAF